MNDELDRIFGGEEGYSPIRFKAEEGRPAMTAEERIARATEEAMTRVNLQNAHKRLHEYRVGVKNLRALQLPEAVATDLVALANSIEDVEWRIEQRIADGAA